MNHEEQWLLPDGVDELLPRRSAVIENLRRQLLDLYSAWGYELVSPPLMEYLEPLLNGAGRDLERETFKITDQISGRLMGIRADITPQVARMDAHSLQREGPVRLCYCATSLRARATQPGASRIPYQIGVELFGHAGVESDREVLHLVLETLAIVGQKDFVLDVGHVGIYQQLVQAASLDSASEQVLRDILVRKARVELDAWLASVSLPSHIREALSALPWLAGVPDAVLADAAKLLPDASAPALAEIGQLTAHLHDRWPGLRVHLDLGELRGYHYHTGFLFAVYVQGSSVPVAKGGRYDHIGEVYGRARPATGFSADLKLLASLLPEQEPSAILAPSMDDASLRDAVATLRAAGERVIQALPGVTCEPLHLGCDRVLQKEGGHWVPISIKLRK